MTKKLLFVFLFVTTAIMGMNTFSGGQEPKVPYPGDSTAVQSIDSIIAKLYAVISQYPGKRNWDEFKNLFLPNARLVSVKVNSEGKQTFYNVNVDQYIEMIRPKLDKANYFEIEIGRRQEEFNNIAQVFSTYKSTLITEKNMYFESGINSFQLVYYKDRWWIVSALFNNESKDNMIPDKYKFN